MRPGQQGEKHREGENVDLRELCFEEEQGKVLCYTPKLTSATNLEDRGKQIFFFSSEFLVKP